MTASSQPLKEEKDKGTFIMRERERGGKVGPDCLQFFLPLLIPYARHVYFPLAPSAFCAASQLSFQLSCLVINEGGN